MAEFAGLVAPLFVPADRPDRFAKAAGSGADATIIDLEDAVAPPAKDKARGALADNLPGGTVVVRINAVETSWHRADVETLARLSPVGVMVPKVEEPAGLEELVGEFGSGRLFVAMIESARGVREAERIAAVPGITQLAFGPADLQNDLGCGPDREAMLAARSAIVLASRLAGLAAPLDGPTFEFGDATQIDSDARYARMLGFGGKLCIHPSQVAPVIEAFLPSPDERAWAETVLAAAGSDGAAAVDGAMIDAPVIARARKIIAAHDRRRSIR